jgi:hypothetical protein
MEKSGNRTANLALRRSRANPAGVATREGPTEVL